MKRVFNIPIRTTETEWKRRMRRCVRRARYVIFLRKSRIERVRVVNELTGDGNVKRDQSMFVKRQI